MAFSDNLQFLRTRQGQTQEQLAEILEVSRQSVSKWESAQSYPEMDTLLRICDLYHVSLDTLMRGSVEDSLVEDTAQYDRFMNSFSKRMAFSIGGIIAGVALCGLLDAKGISEYLICSVLLLIIAACTVVIVAISLQNENFRKAHPTIADFYTEQEKQAFRQKFVWFISGGVGGRPLRCGAPAAVLCPLPRGGALRVLRRLNLSDDRRRGGDRLCLRRHPGGEVQNRRVQPGQQPHPGGKKAQWPDQHHLRGADDGDYRPLCGAGAGPEPVENRLVGLCGGGHPVYGGPYRAGPLSE